MLWENEQYSDRLKTNGCAIKGVYQSKLNRNEFDKIIPSDNEEIL